MGVGVPSFLSLPDESEEKKLLILPMVEGYSLLLESSLTLKGLNLLLSPESDLEEVNLLNLLKWKREEVKAP